MEYALITNMLGVMYAGMLLKEECNENWMCIKPSRESTVNIYFYKQSIADILYATGEKETFEHDNSVVEMSELNVNVIDKTVLIRVIGGVSFRGKLLSNPLSEREQGYWITTNDEKNIVIYIPSSEIEEIFE